MGSDRHRCVRGLLVAEAPDYDGFLAKFDHKIL